MKPASILFILFTLTFFVVSLSNAQDCCPEDGARMLSIQIQYTGLKCMPNTHSQDSQDAFCSDDVTEILPDQAYIIVKNGSGPNSGTQQFAGLVDKNEIYTVEGQDSKGRIGTNIIIEVYSPQDLNTPLQTVGFHTSCSQPLGYGDQFGAHRIISINFPNIGLCAGFDYGDLPENQFVNYNTLRVSDGPSHRIISASENPYLGFVKPDPEIDGQQNDFSGFFGDDTDGVDDEDGIQAELIFTSDDIFTIDIIVNNPTDEDVSVFAWFDQNYNGMFDMGEDRSDVVPAGTVNGTVTLTFGSFDPVPSGGITTYLRLRISSDPNVDMPTGTVSDGEVEDYHVTINAAILPIELVTFEAHSTEDQQVSIKWTTVTESDNDFFQVERSEDGQDFYPIGKVTGSGSSVNVTNYQLLDKQPLDGTNYYRLKQVDFDGTFTYSKIIDVALNIDKPLSGLIVFPNPASSELDFLTSSAIQEDATIQIFDILGQSQKNISWKVKDQKGGRGSIDVAILPPGQYYLKLSNDDQFEIVPFHKGI